MPHPEPERRTNAPPGTERLLAGLTHEQAQDVGSSLFARATGEALRWYADEVLVCEGDLVGKTQAQLWSLQFRWIGTGFSRRVFS